jgi:hypothetical protein
MIVNMIGAITVVPAFYSIVRPRVVTSRLRGPRKDLSSRCARW